MRREDDTLNDARIELNYLYSKYRELKKLQAKVRSIDAELDAYGVSSPRIVSAEEARYQRGTQIYSNTRLLELFAEQDELFTRQAEIMQGIAPLEKRLQQLELSKADRRLLSFRHGKAYSHKHIAAILHCSWQNVQKAHNRILQAYSDLLNK